MFDTKNITKEILTEILKNIDEGIHVVDPSGTTIFYNEVAAKHDGLSASEVIGKPLLTVFPSLTEQTSTLLRVLKTRKEVLYVAQSYTNLHGKKIETMNSTIPITVDGIFVGAMEIAKDYSSLKKLSEQLIDLQKEKHKTSLQKKVNTVKYCFDHLLTKDASFKKVIKEATKLAKSHSSILVFGESGTGKELFVQGVHHASARAKAPFIAQNCAAIPEALLESLLFGTAKGSYTGAVDRPGLFELADGGTLFLDELHAMPIDLQAKLLRVLEDGMVRRVGASKNAVVDVRVIAAMNIHPQKALTEKKLRTDLFYRLNVLTFELPPLRQRQDDILFLAEQFVSGFNERLAKRVEGIDQEVKSFFTTYHWPGNVRELKHTIEYMMNVAEGSYLKREDLPIMLRERTERVDVSDRKEPAAMRLRLELFEKKMIKEALLSTNGNIKQAASLLQVPRQTLQYKIQKFKLGAE